MHTWTNMLLGSTDEIVLLLFLVCSNVQMLIKYS